MRSPRRRLGAEAGFVRLRQEAEPPAEKEEPPALGDAERDHEAERHATDDRADRHRLEHRQRPDDPDIECGLHKEVAGPDEGEETKEGAGFACGGKGSAAALLGGLLDDRLLAHRASDKGEARRDVGDGPLVFEHERRGGGEVDRAEDEGKAARQEIEPGEGEAVPPAPGRVDGDGEDRAGDGGLDAERRRQRPEHDQRAEFGENETGGGGQLRHRSGHPQDPGSSSAATIALIASGR